MPTTLEQFAPATGSLARLRLGVVAFLLITCAPLAQAGIWGSGEWGRMYWGNNTESAPLVEPMNVTIESGPGEFTVEFSFDGTGGNDGWYVVDRYAVTCTSVSDDDDTAEVSGPGTALIVDDLEPGETYACSVVALNELGAGPASAPVLATVDSLPAVNLILINAALCARDPQRPRCGR